MKSRALMPFNYFGSKYRHLDWLLPKLPETKVFVDVFGGSGTVLLNRKPSKIETYNDINSELINFFMVLREYPEEFISQLYFTPYSKEEYNTAYKRFKHKIENQPAGLKKRLKKITGNKYKYYNNIERARNLFLVLNQSFAGTYNRQVGWKMSTLQSLTTNTESVNRWLTKIPKLLDIVERLRTVQISHDDYTKIIQKFDSPDTLFYCDPPYMHSTRCNSDEYEYEMSEKNHYELLQQLKNIQGKFALSCYENELYETELKGYFKYSCSKVRNRLFHSKNYETLYTNYDTELIHNTLFTVANV